MTREEAIQKVRQAGIYKPLVDTLEALGLLKFEEEKPEVTFHRLPSTMTLSELSNLLIVKGYKIVKDCS